MNRQGYETIIINILRYLKETVENVTRTDGERMHKEGTSDQKDMAETKTTVTEMTNASAGLTDLESRS